MWKAGIVREASRPSIDLCQLHRNPQITNVRLQASGISEKTGAITPH